MDTLAFRCNSHVSDPGTSGRSHLLETIRAKASGPISNAVKRVDHSEKKEKETKTQQKRQGESKLNGWISAKKTMITNKYKFLDFNQIQAS